MFLQNTLEIFAAHLVFLRLFSLFRSWTVWSVRRLAYQNTGSTTSFISGNERLLVLLPNRQQILQAELLDAGNPKPDRSSTVPSTLRCRSRLPAKSYRRAPNLLQAVDPSRSPHVSPRGSGLLG